MLSSDRWDSQADSLWNGLCFDLHQMGTNLRERKRKKQTASNSTKNISGNVTSAADVVSHEIQSVADLCCFLGRNSWCINKLRESDNQCELLFEWALWPLENFSPRKSVLVSSPRCFQKTPATAEMLSSTAWSDWLKEEDLTSLKQHDAGPWHCKNTAWSWTLNENVLSSIGEKQWKAASVNDGPHVQSLTL